LEDEDAVSTSVKDENIPNSISIQIRHTQLGGSQSAGPRMVELFSCRVENRDRIPALEYLFLRANGWKSPSHNEREKQEYHPGSAV
jgi:hypothetical protein